MFFHVTKLDLGDEVVLEPNNPGIYAEPCTPRICVAPTIHQCLSAIEFHPNEPIHVYVVRGRKGRKAKGVADAGITDERWLLKPTKAKRIMTFDVKAVKKLHKLGCKYQRGWDTLGKLADQYKDYVALEKALCGM